MALCDAQRRTCMQCILCALKMLITDFERVEVGFVVVVVYVFSFFQERYYFINHWGKCHFYAYFGNNLRTND